MPPDPVALVRLAWDTAGRDGVPALLAFAAEDIAWVPLLDRERVLRGRAAVAGFARELSRLETEVTVSGDTFEAVGDDVIVSGRVRVYSRNGHYDEPMHWRVAVRDGSIARIASARARDELGP
jgi:ketosteroid isomerase-like protein